MKSTLTYFDVVIITTSILYTIAVLSAIVFQDKNSSWYDEWGNENIIGTHVFVLPSIIIMWKSRWYVLILSFSTVISVVYHLQDLGTISYEGSFHMVDMAYQHVVFSITGQMVMFQQTPSNSIAFALLTTTLVAALGNQTILGVSLYVLLLGSWMSLFLIYLILRYFNPTENRRWDRLLISILYGAVSLVTFFLTDFLDKSYYNEIHSIWHVLAYTGMYFSLRSINVTDDYLNQAVELSNVAALAEKRRRKRLNF